MRIKAYLGGPLQTIGYLVFDETGHAGAMIDAPPGTARRCSRDAASLGVKLLYLVNTHAHGDHAADNVALVAATGATLCLHSWDMYRLSHPEIAPEEGFSLPVAPSVADHYLHDGEVLEVGAVRLEVLHTPGHTPGSICVYEREAGVLFTGDTLYRARVGVTSQAGGNPGALAKSLRRLAELPDATLVYPGHGAPTSIREERWLLELAAED